MRLVLRADSLTWDGKPLSFEEPLSEWIKVLGDNYIMGDEWTQHLEIFDNRRIIYPELGMFIEVIWKTGEGVIKDPLGRYVTAVSIALNPRIISKSAYSTEKETPFNTMHYPYAIDFYGAIVDSKTSKKAILHYADEMVIHGRHSNSATLSSWKIPFIGNILFNHFFGEKPEMSVSMKISPSTKQEKINMEKYFGKEISSPRPASKTE